MPRKIDPQLRARCVRLVREHAQECSTLTAATAAVARQEGVSRAYVRRWVAQAEVDGGTRPGLTSEESAEAKRLKVESRMSSARPPAGVDWSNNRRLDGSLGMLTPIEFETLHYEALTLGFDNQARPIELVAVNVMGGDVLIIHANYLTRGFADEMRKAR